MELITRVELVTSSLPRMRSTYWAISALEANWLREEDSNLWPSGYEPDELPTAPSRDIKWWAGMDSNHRSLRRRIYSPFPLTTRAPTHIICQPHCTSPCNLLTDIYFIRFADTSQALFEKNLNPTFTWHNPATRQPCCLEILHYPAPSKQEIS